MTTTAPRLSVVTITYNHEDFIAEALDSFLEQRTEFGFEVIVADDASTDSTADIVRKYAEAHPDVIKPLLRTTNVGIATNLREALEKAQGDYIALCEGDDYWTDPEKLQIQVDQMDAHPDIAVCFHRVRVVFVDGSQPDAEFPTADWAGPVSLDELLSANFIQTNSVVYRRLSDYSTVPADALPLDWYLHVLHAREGRISLLDRTMSVYRRHSGGVWWDSASSVSLVMRKHRGSMAASLVAMRRLFEHDVPRLAILRRTIAGLAAQIVAASTADDPLWWEVAQQYPGFAADAFAAATENAVALEQGISEARAEVAATHASWHEDLVRVDAEKRELHERLHEQRNRIVRQHQKVLRLRRRVKRQDAELERARRRSLRGRWDRLRRALRGLAR